MGSSARSMRLSSSAVSDFLAATRDQFRDELSSGDRAAFFFKLFVYIVVKPDRYGARFNLEEATAL
jgi:hypothetical protein